MDYPELASAQPTYAYYAKLTMLGQRQWPSDYVMQPGLATWAARNLPARLDAAARAKLIGFAERDIHILMAAGKLEPLGDPAPNARK